MDADWARTFVLVYAACIPAVLLVTWLAVAVGQWLGSKL
jgi:hypothetical protein